MLFYKEFKKKIPKRFEKNKNMAALEDLRHKDHNLDPLCNRKQ